MDKVEKTLSDLKNANLYHILEIERTDDHNSIKKAYKKLIKKYHPDKNKEANTVEKFDRIKIAYDLLKNEELKALYDSKLKSKEKLREERKNKKKQMTDKRRKFADDLESREKKHAEASYSANQTNIFNPEEFKDKNKYKQYEEEFNKMFVDDDFKINNRVPKIKSLDEKLNQNGLKIKWKSDLGVIFTKEILKTYFKEFGHIEEIILKENENNALILFNNDRAIGDILNSSNHIIHKLFRIKKYSKKEILTEKQKEFDIRNKFLDAETLDMIRNKRFMSNLSYIQEERNKTTSKNENGIDNHLRRTSFDKSDNKVEAELHQEKKENISDNNLNFFQFIDVSCFCF